MAELANEVVEFVTCSWEYTWVLRFDLYMYYSLGYN